MVYTTVGGRGSQRDDPLGSELSLGFLICKAEDEQSLRKAPTSDYKTNKSQHGDYTKQSVLYI